MCFFSLIAYDLKASSFMAEPIERQIASAEFICPILIQETETRLRGDQVETLAEVTLIEDCLKGKIEGRFFVLGVGGTYDLKSPHGTQRLTTLVHGAPKLEKDARLLLYLSATDEKSVYSLSSWQSLRLNSDGKILWTENGKNPQAEPPADLPKNLTEFRQRYSLKN
ncbi:MAG: hypothetical protein EA369_00205 [Bradymonadales bacterium]|nr:MAG: hypothetical protein EA369_00205 [Bradymonadales bacterium]